MAATNNNPLTIYAYPHISANISNSSRNYFENTHLS